MSPVPKVSVLIPTYNYGWLLDETIQSVLDQSFTDFELIIVDNCSTDNTAEVVKKYLGDPRISFYTNDRNLGLTGNWNKCLEYANGEYIKYLCADDKFHPQIIEKMVDILDRYPDVSIVTCQKQWFGDNVPPKVISLPVTHLQDGGETIFNMMKFFNFIGEPSLPLLRKSNFKVGGFREYSFITDWEMWVRQLTIGNCYIIPEILCWVRQHNMRQTVMVNKALVHRAEEYELYKAIRDGVYGPNSPRHEQEMNDLVRLKAVKCAKEMYKLIPGIYKKSNRRLFAKMYKIAASENAVFDSLLLSIVAKKFRNLVSKKKIDHAQA